MIKKNIILILLLLLHLLLLLKLQFTAWPEMLSFPFLINNGFTLYKDAVHAYPPLLVEILAVLNRIFGYDVNILKIFTWSLFLVNDVLIFQIVSKFTKKKLALFAVLIYVFLQPFLDGNMIWPDVVMVTPLLFASLFLFQKKYFWSGVAIAFACLVKQTGVLYLGIFALYMIITKLDLKKFLLGILMVFGVFLLWLIFQNNFSEFLNWTLIYPARYWTKFPGYVQMALSKRDLLVLGILVLPILVSFKKQKEYLLLCGLILVGFLGVYPRWSFFHFQPALAFLVIIYAFSKKWVFLIVLLCLLVLPKVWGSDRDFGVKIENISQKNEKIYLLGLPSNLYVSLGRLPAKPWIDNFGWYFEIPGVQEELIDSWKKEPPKYVFLQNPDKGNWYDLGVYRPRQVMEFIASNYYKISDGVWKLK